MKATVREGPRLDYPFTTPEPGEVRSVADGVLWLRVPLPISLDHINVYLLEDEGGWTVVDTGLGSPDMKEFWAEVADKHLGGKPVVRVLCTHMHPDHTGMAGWLTRRHGAVLWMSRLEYVTARMLIADAPPAPDDAITFYRAAGWNDEQLESYQQKFGMFGKAVTRFPDSFRRIEDRDDIIIGGRTWRVIVGSGHSPEHVCLWQPDLKLFISGDQVLPRISSIVAVWPTEPAADPLSDWLSSCWRLMAAIPDDVTVLPSHNEPFTGLHARLEHLIEGHQLKLERLERTIETKKRVIDVFGAMFAREIGPGELSMATGETLAHLNYLVRRRRASYAMDADGVAWFTRENPPSDPDDEIELWA